MPTNKPLGPHREKRLTAAFVRTVNTPGFYGDGHGLYLKVDRSGAKRWIQRLVVQGKRRDLGLGAATLVNLAEARELALTHRKTARAGNDPLESKRRARGILSFKEAAGRVHALSEPTWRNAKHGQQWINTLTAFAYPLIGSKKVDSITSSDVLAVLSPIWNTKPETARRVMQRIGTVMKWSMAQGWRSDNPAAAISKALPRHDRSKIQHRKALPYDQVAGAISTVQNSDAADVTKLAFEFMVHTVTRPGETRGAKWEEFDLARSEWIIPAARMKAKRPHRVPLSTRAVAILKRAKALSKEGGAGEYVFPGANAEKPISENTLSKLTKELGLDAVPHGFRSSFRDWAGEQTAHPREVCEFALAHVINDKAEAAYARSDLYEKRRLLMSDWSSYLELNRSSIF